MTGHKRKKKFVSKKKKGVRLGKQISSRDKKKEMKRLGLKR